MVHQHALPTYHLPDGSLPFTSDDEGGYFFAAGLDLEGEDDPRLGPLWRSCVAAQPLSYRVQLTVGPSAFFDNLTLDFDTCRGTLEYSTCVTYRAVRPRDLARWIDQFLKSGRIHKYRLPRPRSPRNAPVRIDHEQGGLADLPPDDRWLDLCFEVLHSLQGERPLGARELRFDFWADPAEYRPIRDQLNAITHRWTAMSDLGYRADFDPFRVPDPRRAVEYQFAVAAYLGKDRDFDEPTLQIDVVHGGNGSWLEFISCEGQKTIAKYAGLADLLDLECRSGPAENRWEA